MVGTLVLWYKNFYDVLIRLKIADSFWIKYIQENILNRGNPAYKSYPEFIQFLMDLWINNIRNVLQKADTFLGIFDPHNYPFFG